MVLSNVAVNTIVPWEIDINDMNVGHVRRSDDPAPSVTVVCMKSHLTRACPIMVGNIGKGVIRCKRW